MRRPPRAEIARDYFTFVGDHRHDATASEEIARVMHDLYVAFLVKARDQHGLSYLQPGRFLCRGSLGDVPLSVVRAARHSGSDRAGARIARRTDGGALRSIQARSRRHRSTRNIFAAIRARSCWSTCCARCSPAAKSFEDTRRAIDAILQSFRYGGGSLLARLFQGAHIDKVLFAATKADHVPDIQRDHLAELLRNMAAFPALDLRSSYAQIDVMALASVVSTTDDTQEIDGQRVQVVVGRPVGSARQAKFFVGTVPIRPPRREAWGKAFLDVPVFEPPAIDASPVDGIPHINLDAALEFLLGDRLR